MDAVLDLAGRDMGRPECGELRRLGAEPVGRTSAEEGSEPFVDGVTKKVQPNVCSAGPFLAFRKQVAFSP